MRAGEFDRRVVLEEARESQDASGQKTETWVNTGAVWAGVQPISSTERYGPQQFVAQSDTKFRLRFRPGVTPRRTLRIRYAGRIYDIQGVIETGRREGLEIFARTRAE